MISNVPLNSQRHTASGSLVLFRSMVMSLWLVIFVLNVNAASVAAAPTSDWPAWRGPTHDGLAASGQNPPIQWSETEGVLWKTPIPGRGHGSPTVAGDRIYLATA